MGREFIGNILSAVEILCRLTCLTICLNYKILSQDLHRCRGTDDTTDLFLCSDELSDPETQCDANINKQEKLKMWWERRVTVAGSDSHMTSDVYKKLVAR